MAELAITSFIEGYCTNKPSNSFVLGFAYLKPNMDDDVVGLKIFYSASKQYNEHQIMTMICGSYIPKRVITMESPIDICTIFYTYDGNDSCVDFKPVGLPWSRNKWILELEQDGQIDVLEAFEQAMCAKR